MILKGPTHKDAFLLNHLYTNSARSAWRNLLRHYAIKAPFTVLMPSYIGYTEREGSGVFDPVLETDTAVDFYPLSKKLSIDPNYLAERFKKNDVKLLLVIHYFGFCPNDMERIAKLCRDHMVVLVEDCAHAYTLGNEKFKLGRYGDFTFYSLHKFFAVESGGVLKVNAPAITLLPIPENEKCNCEVLENVLRSDVSAIIEKRRKNYAYLYSHLIKQDGIEVMYELGKDDIPQSFPILIKQISRPDLYFNLEKKGIPTIALYYRLIDQLDRAKFPLSFEVSDTILNLPIHQDTELEDLDLLLRELKASYLELKA